MSSRVHIITGAGSGIGRLTAQRALAAGEHVVALDLNAAGLDVLGDDPWLLKLTVDVTDSAAVDAAVAQAVAQFGPIDRVTNAAAIMPLGRLAEQPRELIHKIVAINFGGLVNVSKAALPAMLARRQGVFVSYASMAGHWPILYMGAYDASKAAVVSYFEVLYHENRDSGVQFVCVCPPPVATPLLDQARATIWPKTFDVLPPLTVERVVDDVDKAIAQRRFWVFPGPATALAWRLRRWFPGLLWWRVHQMEGE
ncbi:MAG: SDR family NAD(P)-dependent oxidoreductase [Pseudoxanthomonas sp.]